MNTLKTINRHFHLIEGNDIQNLVKELKRILDILDIYVSETTGYASEARLFTDAGCFYIKRFACGENRLTFNFSQAKEK